jgi:hypothetical protein
MIQEQASNGSLRTGAAALPVMNMDGIWELLVFLFTTSQGIQQTFLASQ